MQIVPDGERLEAASLGHGDIVLHAVLNFPGSPAWASCASDAIIKKGGKLSEVQLVPLGKGEIPHR